MYAIVAKRDTKFTMMKAMNNKNLISVWKTRLEVRDREEKTITSLLYNQLCIILNKVLFVDKQLHAASGGVRGR